MYSQKLIYFLYLSEGVLLFFSANKLNLILQLITLFVRLTGLICGGRNVGEANIEQSNEIVSV
jgi:hypothetical protein